MTVALVAAVLLTRPMECVGMGSMTWDGAECCVNGECVPIVDSDDCCRYVVSDTAEPIQAAWNVVNDWHLFGVAAMPEPLDTLSYQPRAEPFANVHSPPDSAPESRLNLPLII